MISVVYLALEQKLYNRFLLCLTKEKTNQFFTSDFKLSKENSKIVISLVKCAIESLGSVLHSGLKIAKNVSFWITVKTVLGTVKSVLTPVKSVFTFVKVVLTTVNSVLNMYCENWVLIFEKV